MDNVNQRAQAAERLEINEDLQGLLADILQDATAIFLRANCGITELEAAHQKVRAVELIRNAIATRKADKAIEDKRKRTAP